MSTNDTIIKKAQQAIRENKDNFRMGESLIFFVNKEKDYVHKVGQMPSYFDCDGERCVVFKKTNKK